MRCVRRASPADMVRSGTSVRAHRIVASILLRTEATLTEIPSEKKVAANTALEG
jgi:hypothetical protein